MVPCRRRTVLHALGAGSFSVRPQKSSEYSSRHDCVFILLPRGEFLSWRSVGFCSQFYVVPPGTARRWRARRAVAALQKCTPAKWARGGMMAFTIGLAGVAIALVDWGSESTIYSYPFLAAAFAGILALSLTANPATTFVGRALTQSWLVYIGRISYGVYLIHVPIFMGVGVAARRIWGKPYYSGSRQGLIIFAAFVAVFSCASISWFCFERPILRLKEYFRSTKPTLESAGVK